eukprot:Blabericola_migrator_1__2855@NODE_1818_length_3743_cov_31_566376_g1168_i0_p7_GENE_NODE_1818_length_3743_cov_31_566376_g1168_i0NODE_1818_length_3743_cov_31_566376_g1168_i0_p7_ORF_typecomplete_len114_score13_31_NODE_1818_length_3743_cov_31_566376_g1168_i017452086
MIEMRFLEEWKLQESSQAAEETSLTYRSMIQHRAPHCSQPSREVVVSMGVRVWKQRTNLEVDGETYAVVMRKLGMSKSSTDVSGTLRLWECIRLIFYFRKSQDRRFVRFDSKI